MYEYFLQQARAYIQSVVAGVRPATNDSRPGAARNRLAPCGDAFVVWSARSVTVTCIAGEEEAAIQLAEYWMQEWREEAA